MTGIRISLVLPEDLARSADEIAATLGISRAEWIRRAITAYLKEAGGAGGGPDRASGLPVEATLERDRLRNDIAAAEGAIGRANEEIAWLRGVIEWLTSGGPGAGP
ncbi:MAG: ribbon-helix-helix protein, CopG family [Methanospirillum sp.]|nr:ribbon-helix-helix protein, CopG family [Methanospirillum sp.]